MKLWFVAKLREEFDVTDLGPVQNIIGLNVLRDRKNLSITINQKIYIRFDHQKARSRPFEYGFHANGYQRQADSLGRNGRTTPK